MRIALITHEFEPRSGQGRVNYELARHMLGRGVDVVLVADQVDPALLRLGANWVKVHPRRQELNLLKVWDFARLASVAVDSVRREVDIVHGNGFVLDRPHEINTSNFVHGAWWRSAARSPRRPHTLLQAYHALHTVLNTRWERRAYRKAELVVAVSDLVRHELASIGVPQDRIRVVLNGVNLEEFRPGEGDRRALGLPEGVPLALFVGEIQSRRKNLDTLLRALVRVPALHLAVTGAVRRSPYPRLASLLGVDRRVHFMGHRDDVPEMMRAADVFVLPSRYEPLGLVLLEALASGLPVVTAATVGAAELVNEDCGIVLSDPNDAGALGAALTSIVNDGEARLRIRTAARKVAEQHSWERTAEQYLALYRTVAASRPG